MLRLKRVLAVLGRLPKRQHLVNGGVSDGVMGEETDQWVKVLIVDTIFATKKVLWESNQSMRTMSDPGHPTLTDTEKA